MRQTSMLQPKFRGLTMRPPMPCCPICGGDRSAPRVRDGDFVAEQCAACQTVYVNPQPDGPSLAGLYADEYFESIYDPQAAACSAYFTALVTDLSRLASPPGRLLEIGPGRGHFLRVAREAGWTVEAVELSGDAARRLRHAGFNVFTGPLDEFPTPDAPLDLVVMWDVLEHTQDPVSTLRRAASLLRPGGLVVVKVPNRAGLRPVINRSLTTGLLAPIGRGLGMTNYYVDHGFHHLFHFTRRGIARAVEAAGLTVERVAAADEPVFDRDERLPKRLARAVVESAAAVSAAREALVVYARATGSRPARPS